MYANKKLLFLFFIILLRTKNSLGGVPLTSYEGDWNSSIQYKKGSLVSYEGKLFLSKVTNIKKVKNLGIDPGNNPDFWQTINLSGINGDTGPKGDTGATGPKGDAGATGPKGDTGAIGPKGDTGAVGPQGNTGAQGAQGVKGDIGLTGPQGVAGLQGPKGDTGLSTSQFLSVVGQSYIEGLKYVADGYEWGLVDFNIYVESSVNSGEYTFNTSKNDRHVTWSSTAGENISVRFNNLLLTASIINDPTQKWTGPFYIQIGYDQDVTPTKCVKLGAGNQPWSSSISVPVPNDSGTYALFFQITHTRINSGDLCSTNSWFYGMPTRKNMIGVIGVYDWQQ
jgi:hypothetical protein